MDGKSYRVGDYVKKRHARMFMGMGFIMLLIIVVGICLSPTFKAGREKFEKEVQIANKIGIMKVLNPPRRFVSLTRNPRATATTDTRGNLGPAEVMLQDPPGDDWIKDRWQAASDMGGTAIAGEHWVEIDLGRVVVPTRPNPTLILTLTLTPTLKPGQF